MKASRSRIKNAIDKAQKRKAGKPKQSKYEAKRFAPAEPRSEIAQANYEDLARHFNGDE